MTNDFNKESVKIDKSFEIHLRKYHKPFDIHQNLKPSPLKGSIFKKMVLVFSELKILIS